MAIEVLLLETGGTDNLLLESSDNLLLESSTAGNTYNEVGSGGFSLGGSGVVVGSYVPSASGGIALGGNGTVIGEYVPSVSAGVVIGGQSSAPATYAPSPSGGAELGGQSDVAATYQIEAAAGVVVGGSTSPEGSIYTEVGSGGVSVGGIASHTAEFTPSVGGGMVAGGTATITAEFVLVGSGGIVAGGYGTATIQLQVVNIIHGRPFELTRITTFTPTKETTIVSNKHTQIEVDAMNLTIPTVTKTTADNLTYSFDFRRIAFLTDDPITGTPTVSQLSGSGSLTFSTAEVDDKIVTVGIGGGTAGQTYRVGLLVTTVNGRTIDGLVDIRVVSRTSSG